MIKLGNTDIKDVKLGNVDIQKVYAGDSLVWQRGISIPVDPYGWYKADSPDNTIININECSVLYNHGIGSSGSMTKLKAACPKLKNDGRDIYLEFNNSPLSAVMEGLDDGDFTIFRVGNSIIGRGLDGYGPLSQAGWSIQLRKSDVYVIEGSSAAWLAYCVTGSTASAKGVTGMMRTQTTNLLRWYNGKNYISNTTTPDAQLRPSTLGFIVGGASDITITDNANERLYELLIYSRQLSDLEIEHIVDHLSLKYGL